MDLVLSPLTLSRRRQTAAQYPRRAAAMAASAAAAAAAASTSIPSSSRGRPSLARARLAATRARRAPRRRDVVDVAVRASSSSPSITSAPEGSREADVLDALRNVIDPDFGEDVVNCGFVKDLRITDDGDVTFTLELTTPACPVKEEFDRLSKQHVTAVPWVKSCNVAMTAQEVTNDAPDTVEGLRNVRHIIAVSSCKGGVGKSTTSVNLAYKLKEMGARRVLLTLCSHTTALAL
jgi:metal-sulfur cluster biosynthetic enzyme